MSCDWLTLAHEKAFFSLVQGKMAHEYCDYYRFMPSNNYMLEQHPGFDPWRDKQGRLNVREALAQLQGLNQYQAQLYSNNSLRFLGVDLKFLETHKDCFPTYDHCDDTPGLTPAPMV